MSARENFDSFVRRQQEQFVASKSFDYEAEKKEYLAFLESLYAQVRSYLDDYISSGTIRLDSSKVQLNEEGIGDYLAPGFMIIIGTQQVRLVPIGTLLIGAKGRVDVVGSAGKARLALVDKHARDVRDVVKTTFNMVREGRQAPERRTLETVKKVKWTWKIMSLPPSTSFIDLAKESFLAMILEVSGG